MSSNTLLEMIHSRKSVRAFKSEQISEDDLSAILAAGKAAPSSLNRQPWHFTVVQNQDLLDHLVTKNREIVLASPELAQICPWVNGPNYHNFYHAPTVIYISGEEKNIWHVCDCALAMENMSLAAHALSAGSCIIASTRFLFQGDEAKSMINMLGIPEGFIPLFALALGYPEAEPKATPRKDDCVNYLR